jgi:hypothetical protein
MFELLRDRAGRRRSPATRPGFHAGHAPGNKGLRYPADPAKVDAIIAVMRVAATGRTVVAYAGRRADVASRTAHPGRLSRLPRATSINAAAQSWSGAARAGAVARSAWTHGDGSSVSPGLRCGASSRSVRCSASTAHGRHWSPPAARAEQRRTAASARVRRRFAPHQLRHAHAVEMARDGVPLIVIQRPRTQQPRDHLRLPQGIDSGEIIIEDRARPTRANDPCQRLLAALTTAQRRHCSSREAALGLRRSPRLRARAERGAGRRSRRSPAWPVVRRIPSSQLK